MIEDEKIIDEFNSRAAETEEAPDPEQKPTDEQIVEKQARGKATAATVLQKRTTLSEGKLEQRIDQILTKNAGKIDESDLRARVAQVLEQKDVISEADLIQIQDSLLREYDAKKAAEAQPELGFQPPAAAKEAADAIGARFSKWTDAASSLKTPGGIGLLVGVLIFMVWVMIPTASGKTRLQILWAVITGQAQWAPKIAQEENQALQSIQPVSTASSNQGGGGMTVPPFLAFTFED